MVIAADGRRSRLAFGRGLARQPRAAAAMGDRRLLHGRRRCRRRSARCTCGAATTSASRRCRRARPTPAWSCRIAIAATRPSGAASAKRSTDGSAPIRCCRARFATRAPVAPPVMLGPMAVDATGRGRAGTAAGRRCGRLHRSDDRRRLALRAGRRRAGGRDRARGAGRTASPIDARTSSWPRAGARAFRAKWRFNRALRSLVASPSGVTAAAVDGARCAVAVQPHDPLRRRLRPADAWGLQVCGAWTIATCRQLSQLPSSPRGRPADHGRRGGAVGVQRAAAARARRRRACPAT